MKEGYMVVLNLVKNGSDGFSKRASANLTPKKIVIVTCPLPKYVNSDDLAVKISELILAFNTSEQCTDKLCDDHDSHMFITHIYLPNTQVIDEWRNHNVSFRDMKVEFLDEFYRESVFG